MTEKYHGQGLPNLASSTMGAKQKARDICYKQEDFLIAVIFSILCLLIFDCVLKAECLSEDLGKSLLFSSFLLFPKMEITVLEVFTTLVPCTRMYGITECNGLLIVRFIKFFVTFCSLRPLMFVEHVLHSLSQ